MKKVLINTRIFAIVLAVIFTIGFNSFALAIDEKKPIAFEIKFIGNEENHSVFELTFSNAEETNFLIVIRDESDYVIYKENITAGYLTKKFLFNSEELGDDAIQFEITDRITNETVIFEVAKKQRFVEDVLISKRN